MRCRLRRRALSGTEPYMITSEIYRGGYADYDAEAVYDAERVYGIELSTRRSSSRCSPGSPSV